MGLVSNLLLGKPMYAQLIKRLKYFAEHMLIPCAKHKDSLLSGKHDKVWK